MMWCNMRQTPKFSIVTPSFNQAAYIGQTIESVLSQAGDFEIEYWVMDGGSTDGSVEIIKHYAEQLASGRWPVRCAGVSMGWVSQSDNGQSDAINIGLRRSSGDILSYINSDDLYCPGAFEQVAREFTIRPESDFVYGDGDVIDETGALQWEWLSRPYDYRVMTSYFFLLHGFTSHITPTTGGFTNYIMQQATFWRKTVLDKIGYFDETLHYAMDAEYWIRAGHAKLHLQHSPYKLGKFRWVPGTKTMSSGTIFWGDYLEIFRRYRGIHRLAIFFAYYYFNLAQHVNYDLQQAIQQGQQVLTRWQHLPAREQKAITQQTEIGKALCCFLVANTLHRQQRYTEAQRIYRVGLIGRPWLAFHPLALWYLLNRMVSPRFSAMLANRLERWILYYHATRFDYRYHPRNQRQVTPHE